MRTLAPISETPSDSSGLRSDRRRASENGRRHGRRATDRVMCQSGTTAREPLWYEQALRPLFVAQLLGQPVNTQAGDRRSALLTYRENARQGLAALFVDTRI